ncbi:hypothetical protein L6270_01490 [Candidatus Parcubacteria bacterium]|nr:hypothetical protein [Patescibacteria group bacterium]MBU4309813.1 hypothetical protein [Patescibacteria group bacterium]MBU4432209.1 hypothetical protein [Patescibacteria group bacterium]MBU4578152.1 hypothetical protein [Patescibacteria group bacterium]MCG2696689.1 hypothetical protein [Candidatus Parcubacteria bacterium]
MFKKISAFFMIAFSLFIMKASPSLAEVNIWTGPDGVDTQASIEGIGFEANDPRTMVANGIKIFLGFLGMLAVILILYAGFLWMTAAGNDDNIKKAKQILSAAVVGLVIILMSYGLASFVLTQIKTATGS